MTITTNTTNTTTTTKKNIIVHGGTFHADDVIAVALAAVLYGTVECSRLFKVDPSTDADFIIDIGGRHDGVRWFDHHQPIEANPDDGVKPCGASLFAQAVLPPELYTKVYERVLRPIAVQDNGQEDRLQEYPNLMFGWVHAMNPIWNSEESPDTAFERAVGMAIPILQQMLNSIEAETEALAVMESAEVLAQGRILVLPKFAPWHEYAMGQAEALYVLHPSNRGGWMVQCVPPSQEEWTRQRMPLPQAWAEGARPEGCTFCHKARFCAAFETRQQAVDALLEVL